MSATTLKTRLAGLLLRSAEALTPAPSSVAPIVLPPPSTMPVDAAAREPLYQRIAYSAIAWMMMVTAQERAAAASIIKRNYPGIAPFIEKAHNDAMAFHEQLRALIQAEQAAVAAELATKEEGATC